MILEGDLARPNASSNKCWRSAGTRTTRRSRWRRSTRVSAGTDGAEAFLRYGSTHSEDFANLQAACCYLMAGDKTAATACLRKAAKSESRDHNAGRYAA